MKKFKLAIFASGSGTNAEEIMKYFKDHEVIEVSILLSNNADAYALQRAINHNVPIKVFTRDQFKNTNEVLDLLLELGVTHVVLAGFLWLAPRYLVEAFSGKIINIHPALLPKYGGKGMYGMKVHEEVKRNADPESGITIHEVNDKYDEGKIVFQAKCLIDKGDTPEQIASKVHQLEYQHYPSVIENWILASP
jgi:phosphoribosylglycinamide formyltransferase-1